MDRLEIIKTLISKGETVKAIKALDDLLVASDLRDELTIISSRFETLEKNIRLGIIDDNFRTLQLNQINHSLIVLIQKITKRLNQSGTYIESTTTPQKRISVFPLPVFLIIVSVGVFFVLKILNPKEIVLSDNSKKDENKIVIKFDFDTLGLFENDIALSKKENESIRYINRRGKIVKNPYIK